jgi:hypothetical protein
MAFSNSIRRRILQQFALPVSMIVFLVAAFELSTNQAIEGAETTAPRSVEEIKTPGDASAFLQRALESTEWVTSQRDFQQSTAAQLAHQQAVDALN